MYEFVSKKSIFSSHPLSMGVSGLPLPQRSTVYPTAWWASVSAAHLCFSACNSHRCHYSNMLTVLSLSAVIGRGGEQINKIQQESGCKVQIAPGAIFTSTFFTFVLYFIIVLPFWF